MDVECPIMIVHAEDDTITPPSFSEKVRLVSLTYFFFLSCYL